MQAWYQRNLLDPNFPFALFISENIQFPPHWHAETEIVYILEGKARIGLNSELFALEPRDILIIGSGDVHHFLPQPQANRLLFVQFGPSFFDSYSTVLSDRRFTRPLLGRSGRMGGAGEGRSHSALEALILALYDEYEKKQEGYQLALKARIYDLAVLLLRQVPAEKYSPRERRLRFNRLERLERVFEYVEEHLDAKITVAEAARAANFSVFHFTRFFKAATGMTFGEYLLNFRIKRAEWYLSSTEDSITEVALKTGFNSLQAFDRAFKELRGCTPKEYRTAIFAK